MSVNANTNENQAQTTQEQAQSQKEINFNQLRKQLEQERAARLAAEERASRIESARLPYKDQDDEPASDEPYVDHRVLDRKMKKMEASFEQKIEQKAEQKARQLIQEERRAGYLKQNADFNEVMKQEHIEKFAQKYPQMAEGILEMPDGFERQKLVYETIKALGVHKKEEPKSTIQDVVDKNKRSPYYSPSGVGTAPYAAAGDYSPAGQKNAHAKMQELKNRLRLG